MQVYSEVSPSMFNDACFQVNEHKTVALSGNPKLNFIPNLNLPHEARLAP